MMSHTSIRLRGPIAFLLAAAALTGCVKEPAKKVDESKSAVADLALTGGAIYTVDGSRSWAQAIAIDDGRVVYVGTDAGAKDYVGPQTKVVPLKGRMVVPGFQDVHIHPISGGIEANSCDLNADTNVEGYVATIKKCAEAHPKDPWITGGGWSMAAFGPGALARKELIDAVVPDRPVILDSRDGHTSWANSKALELAGIQADEALHVGDTADEDVAGAQAAGIRPLLIDRQGSAGDISSLEEIDQHL